MADLSRFPITQRLAGAASRSHPALFGLPTPNGVKVSIMLEETGLPYEAHLVDFAKDDQKSPEFAQPQSQRQDPGDHRSRRAGRQADRPVRERRDPALSRRQDRASSSPPIRPRGGKRSQWLMWQMGGLGPMFGQLGFFNKFAGKDYEDKRPRDRYVAESKRLLGVLDARLAGKDWIMGDDYTIADIATLGLGAQPDRLLRGARAGRVRRLRERRGVAEARAGAAGGAAGADDPGGDLSVLARVDSRGLHCRPLADRSAIRRRACTVAISAVTRAQIADADCALTERVTMGAGRR